MLDVLTVVYLHWDVHGHPAASAMRKEWEGPWVTPGTQAPERPRVQVQVGSHLFSSIRMGYGTFPAAGQLQLMQE